MFIKHASHFSCIENTICFMRNVINGFRWLLKGQFTLKSKIHIFPLTCDAIYPSSLFWCEFLSLDILALGKSSLKHNVTSWHLACSVQNAKTIQYNGKTQQQYVFPEVMTQLLKIIHRPCCEELHVGTTFFLW